MTTPRVALHLREGVLPRATNAPSGVEVLPYPMEQPFNQHLARVCAAEADVHVFADFLPADAMLQSLLRALSRHRMNAAATPNTPALE